MPYEQWQKGVGLLAKHCKFFTQFLPCLLHIHALNLLENQDFHLQSLLQLLGGSSQIYPLAALASEVVLTSVLKVPGVAGALLSLCLPGHSLLER